MKKSLTKKLFIVTTSLLMVFVFLTLSFQSIFFEKFYTNKKIKTLETEVLSFKDYYTQYASNTFFLYSYLQKFEQGNNAKIAIFESNGQLSPLTNPNKTKDPNTLTILAEIYNNLYSDPEFKNKVSKNNSVTSTSIDMPKYNMKYITTICPLSDGNIVIAISSFQSITEAGSIFKAFYIYIISFAIIIVLLLSYIYANLISKPLIKLNRVAKEMSDLNFSVKSDIESDDEIGTLAKTLNFLSLNLDNALSHLKTANEKLLKDIEKEKALENMRKDFIAGVSHELKTPIALIQGYAEGIKDNVADEEGRDFYLDVIIDESNKMESLVTDMLELSKLESPNFSLTLASFNIKVLIENICQKLNSFIIDKNIVLTLNLYDSYVNADEFRIEQVLINFLTNAIRHTTDNGFIKITLKNLDESNIIIFVENSGSKICEDDLINIWNKFYKVDKSRSRTFGGTGLGLSIVRNILNLHKSKFGVHNTESGVEFFFTLSTSKNDLLN